MSTAVSAPGKVFLAGGYLVLDREYTALVFGLSARMHVLVHDIDTQQGVQLSEIVVQSPQFRDATWSYGYCQLAELGGISVTQLQGYDDIDFPLEFAELPFEPPSPSLLSALSHDSGIASALRLIGYQSYQVQVKTGLLCSCILVVFLLNLHLLCSFLLTLSSASAAPLSRNPFVETSLAYALTYISSVLNTTIKSTKVTILADDDYYSQPSKAPSPSRTSNHRFTDFGVRLQDAHKTGLGSSAAVVTAFTGALLTHYLPSSHFSLSTPSGRSILHNLAQAAHCAAQGKVGSGFDIATAVYGTCIYRRFSPSILSSLGEPGSPNFSTRLRNIVEDTDPNLKWDTEISKEGVAIPEGMALVMCDVDCGSQTVGMVKSVLSWRGSSPEESKKLWDELHACNINLAHKLVAGEVEGLPRAFGAIREKIRLMGKLSGVPIEPPEQTELLDAVTHDVAGVEGGVVPGAGGYDAIVLLVKDDEQTMEDLRAFLKMWSEENKSNVKLLGTRGELEGARVEDAESYAGFISSDE